jgi:DNA-binding MarR family transcriptional regulator
MARRKTNLAPHRPTQKEKTQRAFRTYLDLLDTAEWLRRYMRGPLESFVLTMGGVRLLELLYRKESLSVPEAAYMRGCQRQNMDAIVARLEERGWVSRTVEEYEPAEIEESRLPKAMRGRPREGRRIGVVRLTRLRRKFIGDVFPRHAKVVKALMRVLDAREKDFLSRICRKLRAGDGLKFYSEMTHQDEDEWE